MCISCSFALILCCNKFFNLHCAQVRLVVKADVQGSMEAVRAMVDELNTDMVSVKVLYAGVGPVNSSDINLAAATGAALVTFNLGGLRGAPAQEADGLGVKVLGHNIIYHLMDMIKGYIEGGLGAWVRGRVVYTGSERIGGMGRVYASCVSVPIVRHECVWVLHASQGSCTIRRTLGTLW